MLDYCYNNLLISLTLSAHALAGYSSFPVCLSVRLSRFDFGDYWPLTIDLGMNLLGTKI